MDASAIEQTILSKVGGQLDGDVIVLDQCPGIGLPDGHRDKCSGPGCCSCAKVVRIRVGVPADVADSIPYRTTIDGVAITYESGRSNRAVSAKTKVEFALGMHEPRHLDRPIT